MRTVFADAVYWIAVAKPKDAWKESASSAREKLGQVRLVTTDEVLTELLAAFSRHGAELRQAAGKMVRAILSNPNVRVVPQSRDSFRNGLQRYEARPDKEYSLQDCISMNIMQSEGIEDILTNDHHFEQEGFTVLMKRE